MWQRAASGWMVSIVVVVDFMIRDSEEMRLVGDFGPMLVRLFVTCHFVINVVKQDLFTLVERKNERFFYRVERVGRAIIKGGYYSGSLVGSLHPIL